DILTVADRLRTIRHESDLLGPAYLVELTESCPVTQNIEHYAHIVRTDFYRRRVIYACQDVIKRSLACDGKVDEFIGEVEREFLQIANEHDRKGIVLAKDVL